MCRANRTVIFAVAQLSCFTLHSVDNTGSDSEEDTPAAVHETSPILRRLLRRPNDSRPPKNTGVTQYIPHLL